MRPIRPHAEEDARRLSDNVRLVIWFGLAALTWSVAGAVWFVFLLRVSR